MQLNGAPIILILVFVSVLLIVQGIYLAVFGKSIRMDQKVSRRLELLQKGSNREQVLAQLRKEMNQHLNMRGIPLYSLIAKRAQRANLAFSPYQLVAVMFGVSVFAYFALTALVEIHNPTRMVLAISMGVGGVYIWVGHLAKKRMQLMESQLADAVELMVRSLRVGHPLISALGVVARETPDPLGSEFGFVSDEAAYGRDIGDALKAFAERVENQDLRFLAVAVAIQQQSGGNLADVLKGLAQVIRARYKLARRVQAITAEARFSGGFLSAFPVLALIGISLLDPTYYDEVKNAPIFLPVSIFVFVFLGLNVIYMRIMTDIRI